MHQVAHRRGSAVALLAACLLVLQSLLSGWAAAQAAPMLDAFGNPLCLTSAGHDGGTAPPGDHSSLPQCCALGCGAASPLLAAGPTDETGLLRPLSSAAVRFEHVRTFHDHGPDHDPASPRAPPLIA